MTDDNQEDRGVDQHQDQLNGAVNEGSGCAETKDLTNMREQTTGNRRSVLKNIGLLGAGSLGLSQVGVASSKQKPNQKEIDYALRREVPGDPNSTVTTRTKMVPRDWYRSLKRAEEARKGENFESRPYVNEVDLIPPMHGGAGPRIEIGIFRNPDSSVRPDLPSTQKAKDKIPATVGDIPVNIHESTEFELGCYEYDYGDSVPAGADMEAGYDNSYCTMGALLNKNGNSYFSTCQHLFYGDDPESKKLYNQDTDSAIGDITDSYCRYDFVVAEPINGHTPTYRLADSGGNLSNLTIVEQFTKDALQDKVANEENLTKRGVRTCETSGQIRSADGYIGYVDSGCGDRYNQLKWGKSGDFDRGDSGAVAYQQIGSDQVAVAGTCNGFDPLANDRVYGQSAYSIEDFKGYMYI